MRNAFNLRFGFLVVFLSLFSFAYALPPEGITVKGRVIDDALKEGVPGASISVKGAPGVGTITDFDGNYTIVVPSKESVLVFSFIGYSTQEITVGDQQTINVTLKEDTQTLQEVEVVAIAYGNQDKNLVTSAVSSIRTEELLKTPQASVTNMLAGAVPGISSVQTTGQPGKDAATLYVRGSGTLSDSQASPLVLVDGVERDFSQIDPNEVETISVLKDAASTAVFGVRGANGVILVTTRRGQTGEPTINVSTSLDLQQPISLVEQVGSYEYAKFWNIKQNMTSGGAKKGLFTPEQIEAYRTGSDPIMYPSIDWQDYIFRNVFLMSRNNLNISGGSENVKYFISLGYLYQNGMLKELPGQTYDNNYRYNRYNYRANIDANLTKTTTMKLNIGGYLGQVQEPRSVVSEQTGEDQNPWVIAQIWTHPFAGPGFVNGVRTLVPYELTPLGEVMRDGMFVFYGRGYDQTYTTTLNMDVEFTQKLDFLTPGLSVSVKGAYDNQFGLVKTRSNGDNVIEYQTVYYASDLNSGWTLPQTDPSFDKTYVYSPTGQNLPLNYSESSSRAQNWYLEARADYSRTFGDHKVSGLLLYNQSRDYYPSSYTYLPRNYVGLVGRATYGYRSKYLLDVNIGYNGSENFAPGDTRFGLFPAFSAGWVMSAEDFMQNQSVIDYLKFRISWGRVGNDQGVTSRFMYMPGVWYSGGSYYFGTSENASTGYYYNASGNPLVTWETADKQNYGFDVRLLDERLSLTFDYFIEKRRDILITPNSTPGIIGFSLPNMNIGKVNNHGYEIALGWSDKINENFNYFVNANVSFARNKIIDMDEVPNEYSYMDQTGGSTGRYTNMYKFVRLYQYSDFNQNADGTWTLKPELPQPYVTVQPGDAMYADLNHDNVVDGNDRGVFGYAIRPEYTFGLNAGFNWKGLSFSMQWTGATNVNRQYDIEYRIPFTNAGTRGLLKYFYDGCWTPENQLDAKYPRPSEDSESWNSEDSTLWLVDASYLRLKNISLGYTFRNNPLLKKLGISSMGLTFTGYNLLTFSPLKYLDPESDPDRFGSYPLVKTYSFGLNLNF